MQLTGSPSAAGSLRGRIAFGGRIPGVCLHYSTIREVYLKKYFMVPSEIRSSFYPLDVEKLGIALCLGEREGGRGREIITNNLMWKRCRIIGPSGRGLKQTTPTNSMTNARD